MSTDSLYFHTPEPTPAPEPAAPKPEPKPVKTAPAKPADKWKPYKLGQ